MPDTGPPAEPLLMSAADAARMLSCCTKTLWALRRDGKLRAVHIGPKGIRFSVADLKQFIEAAKAAPVAVEGQP